MKSSKVYFGIFRLDLYSLFVPYEPLVGSLKPSYTLSLYNNNSTGCPQHTTKWVFFVPSIL